MSTEIYRTFKVGRKTGGAIMPRPFSVRASRFGFAHHKVIRKRGASAPVHVGNLQIVRSVGGSAEADVAVLFGVARGQRQREMVPVAQPDDGIHLGADTPRQQRDVPRL